MVPASTHLEKQSPAAEAQKLPAGIPTIVMRARLAWSTLNGQQRRWGAAAFLMLACLISGLLWYALRTDWRVLYSGLDPDDARQIGLTLTQAQIPYDVADNGMTLRVPGAQLDKARLATASKGGVKSGRMGFELFDRPNWVGSEFDEQVNYQRALEGELERTVGSLSDIESAHVHLVLMHDSLFRDQARSAKASVVLKLRHGSLAEGEPDSIRNLVSSAVDGLSPDHVVLVDASGRLTLGPKTPEALRLNAEHALEEKIIATLEPVTGPGNVRASVTLDYDPDAVEETRETYDPAQSATLSMERTEQSTGGQPVAAGVPGTASNGPNTQSLPVYPRQTSSPQTAKTESGTYGVSKTTRHTTESSGKIRRLTAAIVVNDRLVQAATARNAAQWQTRSSDELRNLGTLAQAAVGFDTARGDVVTVQDLPFEGNGAQSAVSAPAQIATRLVTSPLLLKYLSLLAGLCAVLIFGVRPALLRVAGGGAIKSSMHLPDATSAALPEPEVQFPDPNRAKTQEIFERVRNQLEKEPAQSSRLLQSWIHSE
jgi:flagellar M-ring protein FliF